jgi:hypothetical protein
MAARYEYLNTDAYEDLLLQIALVRDSFRTYAGPAMLTATLYDGTAIKGTETVCVAGDRALQEAVANLREFFRVCAERGLGLVGWW